MSRLKKYLLHFRGVPVGTYNYQYIIKDDFFDNFPESQTKKGNLVVDVVMSVKQNYIELYFYTKGTINLSCDVCLDDFDFPIESEDYLKISFGEEGSDITNVYDHIILADSENDIQLAQHIYDYIHLCIPAKVVHGLDNEGNSTCNPEMLEKLEELTPTLNEDKIDQRWSKLNSLKF